MEASEVDLSEFEAYIDLVKEGGSGRPLVDKQPTDTKLQLYAYGRQGRLGDCTEPKPGMFALVEKKKWEAYMGVKGTPVDEAKAKFLTLAKKILGK